MEIELNGAPHHISENQHLQELIASLALTNQMLAVAVNREVVARLRWSHTVLQVGDRVDIVRAIGGG